jgi:two-component system response regulator MprA
MESSASVSEPIQILVVDDDPEIRETMRFALEDEGYTVVDAEDGASALQMLRQSERRMVVLLDELMPNLEGTEMLRTIAADPELVSRHTYVLVTASAKIGAIEERIRNLDGLDVPIVMKPFDLAELLAAVETATGALDGRPTSSSPDNPDNRR